MNEKQISVIIPTYKSLNLLKRTIDCLEKQQPDPKFFEVIVVDDASGDETEAWLSKYCGVLDLKYIVFSVNQGRSSARNAGVEKSSSSLLLLVDGDMEFNNDFIQRHVDSHKQENQVIVGSVGYDRINKCRGYARYLERRGAMKLKPKEVVPGRFFLSGNSSLSRLLFDSVGGFDESLKSYGEDIDLGIRLSNQGALFTFNPTLKVQHLHIRTLNELFKTSREYGRNTIPELLIRYPELKYELKIEWVQKPGITGALIKLLLSKPFYYIAKVIIRSLNEIWAPDLLYSYLIFRNYYFGYLEFVKEQTYK